MALFTPDLYRNFGIGFVATALALGAASIDDWSQVNADFAPAAQAAEVPFEPVEVAPEFLIEVEE
ncbi:hypothetical protein [uncultured Erythrobacter sp.]|uniref:hypothetical protein n=1 Tax=uncultured Erythrobacter sp. TaxID=263913 RepID=UPI002603EC75|nr:hypothetical protein [uncultured Erythrobacter sp.]